MGQPTCVDLRRYGETYRVRNEPDDRPARATDDPWDLIIPGQSGFVAPWGGDDLLACTRGGVLTRKVVALIPGAVVRQQEDNGGANVRFHADHFPAVADLLRLRRRRHAPAAAADRLKPFRYAARQSAGHSGQGSGPPDGSGAV